MKILLVAGIMHRIISSYTIRKIDIVNSTGLRLRDALDFLRDVSPAVEGILITDEAFSGETSQDKEDIAAILELLAANSTSSIRVRFVTRDVLKEAELNSLISRYGDIKFMVNDYVRAPASLFESAFTELMDKRTSSKPLEERVESRNNGEGEKKKSFFDRFRPKPKSVPDSEREATDALTNEINSISRGISRIVAVTGHRGSGLTSTSVNLACEANKRGLSAIILDMDAEYRSANMYFSGFHEMSKKNEDINASLIRTLARPQDYLTTAFNIKDNLWLAGLGYHFSDRMLMEQFYTSGKLVGLLSMLRSKFNIILLDMPMDLMRRFQEVMIHIDVFGLCVPNNLYSILSLLRNVEVTLNKEEASYLNAKAKVIVTQYNDRSRFQGEMFIPEKVAELMSSGLSDCFRYEMATAGHVPYSSQFDSQIETDIALVDSSKEYEKAFGQILLRLMEGAK